MQNFLYESTDVLIIACGFSGISYQSISSKTWNNSSASGQHLCIAKSATSPEPHLTWILGWNKRIYIFVDSIGIYAPEPDYILHAIKKMYDVRYKPSSRQVFSKFIEKKITSCLRTWQGRNACGTMIYILTLKLRKRVKVRSREGRCRFIQFRNERVDPRHKSQKTVHFFSPSINLYSPILIDPSRRDCTQKSSCLVSGQLYHRILEDMKTIKKKMAKGKKVLFT